MEALLDYRQDLLAGFWLTIQLALAGGIGSLLLGTLLAAMRVSPSRCCASPAASTSTSMRNTPLTLVIFFCRLRRSAPTWGWSFSDTLVTNAFWLAVVGLIAYTSAFVCEAIRSGHQHRAARPGRGGPRHRADLHPDLRLVVLPQAFRAVIAPAGQRADRADQEHHDRGRHRRRPRRPA